ncbi:hypothetical protein BASA81_006478 [Batrachochytrium salamandrivorans]|nr:hypothetical protein BASA81_006478 [Batrachochytrium salamandrivorans]
MAKGLVHGTTVLMVVNMLILLFSTFTPMWLVIRNELGLQQCWFGQGIWIAEHWWGADLTKAALKCQDPLHRGHLFTQQVYCEGPGTEFNQAMCQATSKAKLFMLFSLASSLLSLAQSMLLGFLMTLCTMDWPNSKHRFWTMLNISAIMEEEEEEEEDDDESLPKDVLPSSFHRVRRYSMYGAIARRFHHLPRWKRFFGLTLAPVLLVLCNAVSWLAYILLGIQIIVHANISIVHKSKLTNMVYLEMDPFNPLLSELQSVLHTNHTSLLMENFLHEMELFDDIVNAFNFSPITSVYFFWTTKAYLTCLGMFGAVFALPIIKVVVWMWVFFTPFPEISRGRVLMILDAVGKYALANLYMLTLISIALIFKSNFVVVPLSVDKVFLIRVEAGTSSGNGVGSYMFVITAILSLIVGQLMVRLHSMCCSWEEDRRSNEGMLASPILPPTSSSTTQGTHSTNNPNARDEDSAYLDTPFITTASIALTTGHASSSITSPLLGRNNLRASFADLSNLHQTHPSHHSGSLHNLNEGASFREGSSHGGSSRNISRGNSQEHVPNIVRALAKYGSRATLQVMAKKQGVVSAASSVSGGNNSQPRLSSLREEQRALKQKALLHPYVEALCDRVFSPEHGVQLKFTPTGKIVVWFLVFFTSGIMLVCQSVPLFEVHRSGVTGDLVVKPKDRYQSYSLVSLMTATLGMGFEVPAIELSTLMFVMTAMMPVMTAFGLAMLWGVPLTLKNQERLFNWLEIASAWSSLDICFLCIAAIYIEIQNVILNIIEESVPKVSQLIKFLLPFEDGVLNASFRLEYGFWILAAAVIAEKLAIILVTEGAVQAITERRAELFLKQLAMQQQQTQSPLVNTRMVADAAEGLLESDAILAFAPAGRYFSAMFPRSIYAGLPRTWWANYGVRTGLMADARAMTLYAQTGRSLEEEDEEEEEEEDEDEELGQPRQHNSNHDVGRRHSIISEGDENVEESREVHYEYAIGRQNSPFGLEDEEDTGPISF